MLIHLTVSCLDPITRKDWEKHLGNRPNSPTLEQLREFLQSQTLTLEVIEGSTRSSSSNALKSNANPKSKRSEQIPPSLLVYCKRRQKARIKEITNVLCAVKHIIYINAQSSLAK